MKITIVYSRPWKIGETLVGPVHSSDFQLSDKEAIRMMERYLDHQYGVMGFVHDEHGVLIQELRKPGSGK